MVPRRDRVEEIPSNPAYVEKTLAKTARHQVNVRRLIGLARLLAQSRNATVTFEGSPIGSPSRRPVTTTADVAGASSGNGEADLAA